MDWNKEIEYSGIQLKAQRLYTAQKIKNDPLHYSLKDRCVIYPNASFMLKKFPNLNVYSDETRMLEQLLHARGGAASSGNASWKWINYPNGSCVWLVMPDAYLYYNNMVLCAEKIAQESSVLQNDAALKIAMKTYAEKYMPAVLDLLIRLKQSDTLIRALKTLLLDDTMNNVATGKTTLQDVLDLKLFMSDEGYICKGFDNAYPLSTASTVGSSNEIAAAESRYSSEDLEKVLKYSIVTTTMFGIELLHAWKNMTDLSHKNTIEEMLLYRVEAGSHPIYSQDTFGNIVIDPDIDSISDIEDPESRFEEIAKFIIRKPTFGYDRLDLVIKHKLSNLISPHLSMFIQYCDRLSTTDLRIRYLVTLFKQCKAAGVDMGMDIDVNDDSMASLFGTSGTAAADYDDDGDDDEFADEGEGSLFHKFCRYSKDMETKSAGKHSVRRESIDALDKITSSTEDNGYTYKIKNVDSSKVSADVKDRYESIAKKVALVNNVLTTRLREIKTYNTGGKESGLTSGRLDRKNLYRYRTSSNIFCKNTYKIKESDLAIGVLLDVSGSMTGKGIQNGVTTLIVLHETLKALGINHCIATHTSNGAHSCSIDVYQHFRESKYYKVCKNYAIAGIHAHTGNCDSGALHYMEKALLMAKNKDKICLIFSDGEPTECTDAELVDQVKLMEHEGIKTIGIGIDFPSIKRYYKDNANGKSLKEMLDIVSNILKTYILEKE